MVILNRPHYQNQPHRSKGPPLIHYGSLQSKFTLFLTGVLGGAFLVFGLTVWIMAAKNYSLMRELALATAPHIVPNLERELNLLAVLTVVIALVISAATFFVIKKRLSKIQGPLYALERQMRSLVDGDWSAKDIRTRRDDEFQSLVGASNLLYHSLRNETLNEIEFLESLLESPITPDSRRKATVILKNKRDRLKLTISSETVVNFVPSHEKRHVS